MSNFLELGTAFLEGFLVTVSPCVLSILPIVLSSSIDGGKWRPIGVIIGLMASFVFFSIFIGHIFQSLGVRPEVLRLFASLMILVFGSVMIFSSLGNHFSVVTNRITKLGNWIGNLAHEVHHVNGLLSGLLVGVSLGLIWTPCIGPLVGTAMAQAASQISPLHNLAVIGSFCAGIALPMLMVAFLGKLMVNQLSFLKQNGRHLQRVFGSIIVLSLLFTSKPTFHFVENWVKFNILGDKSVNISAVTGLNNSKYGCRLDV